MVNHKAAGRVEDRLSFSRNGRTVVARRTEIGHVEVTDRRLKIADAMYGDEAPPLPIIAPNGLHAVHSYLWDHPRGAINVCVVLRFRPQRFAIAKRLTIANQLRPDLSAGIIVDSAEVRVGGASSLTLRSGLGGGYYPVFAVYNLGFQLQAVVCDFRIDLVREVILLPGQELDEFAIVRHR